MSRLRFLMNPKTKQPDGLLTMSCIVVGVCAIKFLFEGVSFVVFGHTVSLGHADALSYGAMLTPVLGAHGASEFQRVKKERDGTSAIDNPDGDNR